MAVTPKDVWYKADYPLHIVDPAALNTPYGKQKLWANAYGSIEVNASSNIHCKWDLAVETANVWSARGLIIGITSTLDNPCAFHMNTECINYGYQPYYSQVFKMNVSKKYGRKYIEPNPIFDVPLYNATEFEPAAYNIERYRREQSDAKFINKWEARDDVKSVSVELNLATNHLSFWLNGFCQGVAYFVPNQKGIRYRLAISSCNHQKQIHIKSFKQLHNINNAETVYYAGYLKKQSKYIGTYKYRWMVLKGDRKLYSYKPNNVRICTEIFDLTVYDQIERKKDKFKIFSSENPQKIYRMFYPKNCDVSTMDDWVRMIQYVQQNKDETNSMVEEKKNDEYAITLSKHVIEKSAEAVNAVVTKKEQSKIKSVCVEWSNEEVINWIFSIENGLFKQRYGDALANELKTAEIDGSDLVLLQRDDMKSFGINVFKHQKLLEAQIAKLRNI